MAKAIALTVFQGRAGDHNDLAIPGAAAIGWMLAEEVVGLAVDLGRRSAIVR